jgi:phage FluMu gp28-like protein
VSQPVLYPYQRRYLADASRWKAAMWSRQTGKTFTTTLEAVLDCLEAEAEGRARRWTIMSVSQARAQDAIETAKQHLRAVRAAFEAVDQPLDVELMSYELRLAHGSRIRAIASRPETARGMTENLILDEFAHHPQDRELWRAVLPVVSRPDLKLRVISTPNGKGNLFYEIMTSDAFAGLFSRHTVTIHDAVADGLPRNVDELRRAIADPVAWAQEYECEFVDAATAWLPYELIDGCEDPAAPGEYLGGPCYVGMDIAARGDLTVIVVLEDDAGVLWMREMLELRGQSFAAQLAALDRIMREYRIVRAAIDQTGMGEMPVEEARRRHGAYRVEGVIFSPARKLDLATALRERMEDRRLRIPVGMHELRVDLHGVQRVAGATGAPRLVAERQDGSHADRFWALALACAAAADERPDYAAWASAGRTDVARLSAIERAGRGWGAVTRRVAHGY